MSAGLHLDAVPVPYVRGHWDTTYDVPLGIKDVDRHLGDLRQRGALSSNEDITLLLDARLVLAAREKAAGMKGATA